MGSSLVARSELRTASKRVSSENRIWVGVAGRDWPSLFLRPRPRPSGRLLELISPDSGVLGRPLNKGKLDS